MAITGDYNALRALGARLTARATQAMLTDVAQRLAATSIKLVADGFRQSRDPYARAWRPVFRRRKRDVRARARRQAAGRPVRADRPLVDTGRMAASVTAQPRGASILVTVGTDYAEYHQRGTRHITRRRMLPTADGGGIGPVWGRQYKREASAIVKRALTGGG